MYFVSAYHGGTRSKDGMQQLSYSETKLTLWGWRGEKNLKFKPDIQRKKYEQLASMSTNAINKNKGMHQRQNSYIESANIK